MGLSLDLSCSGRREGERSLWLADWRKAGYLYNIDSTGISLELKIEILNTLIGEIAEVEFYLDQHLESTHLLVNSL